MITIDRYYGRTYHPRTYNCAHFVCDVWQDCTGQNLRETLQGFLCAPYNRRPALSRLRALRVLGAPVNPCMVLLQGQRGDVHIGVWWSGRILHLAHRAGVQYQPLEVVRIGFRRVRFLTCR